MAAKSLPPSGAIELRRPRPAVSRVSAAASASEGVEAFSLADERFHLMMVECTHNPLMIWLYQQINDVRSHAQWGRMKDAILSQDRIAEYNEPAPRPLRGAAQPQRGARRRDDRGASGKGPPRAHRGRARALARMSHRHGVVIERGGVEAWVKAPKSVVGPTVEALSPKGGPPRSTRRAGLYRPTACEKPLDRWVGIARRAFHGPVGR